MIFTNMKIALQYNVHSNSFYLLYKKEPRRGILIFADFDPIGYAFHAVVVFTLGYDFCLNPF